MAHELGKSLSDTNYEYKPFEEFLQILIERRLPLTHPNRTISITIDRDYDIISIHHTPRNLSIQSSPASGAFITVIPNDIFGAGSNNTNLGRIYNDGVEVALTAAADHGGRHFIKWMVNDVENPNRSITVVMDGEQHAEAIYSDLYTLTVESSPAPATSGPVSVSPADVDGHQDGYTSFTRTYNEGTAVELTASAYYSEELFFGHWLVDGVENPSRSIRVVMTDHHEAEAVFVDELADDRRVRIGETVYGSIQEALAGAADGNEIHCAADVFVEDPVLEQDITTTLRGGYAGHFTSKTGATTIQGAMIIHNGAMVIEDIVIGGPGDR